MLNVHSGKVGGCFKRSGFLERRGIFAREAVRVPPDALVTSVARKSLLIFYEWLVAANVEAIDFISSK